jgi:hypothetical protein
MAILGGFFDRCIRLQSMDDEALKLPAGVTLRVTSPSAAPH